MGKFPVIDEPTAFPVQPADIDASKHLWSAFDNRETEISAGWLIRFCQQRGKGWEPFTYEEINGYYREHGHNDGFLFNQLVDPEMVGTVKDGTYHCVPQGEGFIVKGEDKQYYFTEEFVQRAHKSSPAAVSA